MASCKRIIKINNGTCVLNEDIYVGRGDKLVKVLFELDGFKFNDGNMATFTGAKVLVRKSNGDKIDAEFKSFENDMIVWEIDNTLIDDIVELGCHDFQVVLTDGTAEISLPVVYNQFHVFDSLISDGNNSNVNSSTINHGHIATGDESDIFTDTKGYNATNWAENDVITDGKLNKIEDALTYLMSNNPSMISPVGNVLTLKEEKLQVSEISKTTTIVLPAINYVADFVLFLNCTMDLDVIFQSSADTQKIRLAKGYHKISFKFISDWLISC